MSAKDVCAGGMWVVSGRRLIAVLSLMLLLMGSAAFAAELSPKGGKSETPGWEGNESELAQPFTAVITNEADWKALWENAFHKKAPAVDFNRYAVACVFLGHYPGWWYHIGFAKPREADSTIIVPYDLADFIVELKVDGSRFGGNGLEREYGSRGQYKMQLVEKKPGFSMKLELVGQPQVSLKKGFKEILEKDRIRGAK